MCLFCKINKKEIKAYTIFEDNNWHCFLDINPTENGHLLIVSKQHLVEIDELSYELWSDLQENIKLNKKNLINKLHCDGVTIIQNNGYGQDIEHFHVHLVPKYIRKQGKIGLDEIQQKIRI
jgi:histidine triad (HIT) family protein